MPNAVVPGGGPSLDGLGWLSTPKNYLVSADALRSAYRRHFLHGLTRLKDNGELRLDDQFAALRSEAGWLEFLDQLESTEWVSYIEPPPCQESDAAQVIKYLGRYLTGGPISDHRLLAADEREVIFLARAGQTPGGEDRQVAVRLSTLQFTRRWALHVLPSGYTKTRHYGGWSNRQCEAYLDRCVRLLNAADAPLSAGAADFDPSSWDELPENAGSCPACGGALQLVTVEDQPSWRDVMNSLHCPAWYAARDDLRHLSGFR